MGEGTFETKMNMTVCNTYIDRFSYTHTHLL